MGPITSEMSKKGAIFLNEIREGKWDKNFIFAILPYMFGLYI